MLCLHCMWLCVCMLVRLDIPPQFSTEIRQCPSNSHGKQPFVLYCPLISSRFLHFSCSSTDSAKTDSHFYLPGIPTDLPGISRIISEVLVLLNSFAMNHSGVLSSKAPIMRKSPQDCARALGHARPGPRHLSARRRPGIYRQGFQHLRPRQGQGRPR